LHISEKGHLSDADAWELYRKESIAGRQCDPSWDEKGEYDLQARKKKVPSPSAGGRAGLAGALK